MLDRSSRRPGLFLTHSELRWKQSWKAWSRKECWYSEWATPVVIVPKKDGTTRLCGNYKVTVYPVLEVDQYPLPKPEDLFASLSGGSFETGSDRCLQLEGVGRAIADIGNPQHPPWSLPLLKAAVRDYLCTSSLREDHGRHTLKYESCY